MDGLWWKTLLKWMIWGYHYFLETPIYTWYISHIYCQFGGYMLPTTLYKNLKKSRWYKGTEAWFVVGWDPDDELFPHVMEIPWFFQGKSISKFSWIWHLRPFTTWVFLLGSSPCFFWSFFNLIPYDAMGEVGVISLPWLKRLLSLRCKVKICLSPSEICPKVRCSKTWPLWLHHDTTPERSQAPQPWSVAPCRTLPYSEEGWGFLVGFCPGKVLGVFGNSAGVTSKDWRRKVFGSRLDWNTWVVSFSRKTGAEMQPPTYLVNG